MKNLIIVITIIATAMFFGSCGSDATSGKEKGHEEGGHEEHGGGHDENESTVTLSSEQMKSIKMQLGSIEKKQLTASLKANGILKVPNQNKASATSLLGGVVKTILVQPGNTVTKGQTIATIGNTAFIILQEEFLTVSAKTDLAQIEFERQKELNKGNAGSLKILQQSEAEIKGLKARKSSLQKQLELIGINPTTLTSDNISSVLNITSPISGAVSSVLVNIGSNIDANTNIAEIVDNSQLHLDLYVYEKDLTKLKEGQTIHFTLTNNAGKEYDAKVYGISNTFEENTKAIAVHAQVEGDKTGLIDGMSITALVSLENPTVDAVPTDAIVSLQGQDFIFVVTDEHGEEEHHAEGEKENGEAEHKHVEGEKEEHADAKSTDKHDEHGHAHAEGEKKEQPKEGEMTFEKIPVRKGTTDVGYSEITLLKEIPANSKVVVNGAFFILAKMSNKGEGHQH
ncbi:MAG: efflux RND transporter periplasmic adaptor subunit [Bacteroidia bacterium]|nr:efflux RND transporter periplasmic adaptor subunit [Bacteroidia bacterium]